MTPVERPKTYLLTYFTIIGVISRVAGGVAALDGARNTAAVGIGLGVAVVWP